MNETKAAAGRLPLRLPAFNDIMPSLMLVLASRASAIGMLPFGMAFFAAAFDESAAYLGIAAICAGTAAAAGAAAVPKYLLAAVAYWLFAKLCGRENEILRSAAAGVSLLLGGAVMLFSGFNGLYDIFLLLTESVITAVMYIVFKRSRIITAGFSERGTMSEEEYISAAVTVGIIIAGLTGIEIGPVKLTGVFAVYAVLIAALNSSAAQAGCTGMCIGFFASISGSYSIIMTGVCGLGALFASFMNSFHRIGCAVGYLCTTAVTLIYVKNIYAVPLGMIDIFIGASLFLLTPNIVHEYFRTFFTKSVQVESVSPDARMREYLAMRLRGASDAFGSLHECFTAVSEGRLKKYSDDVGGILDETASRVCGGCRLCGKCWQADFRRTYKNVLGLIGIIEKDGTLSRENAPEHFCERCVRTDMFLREINHVYELYKREVLRRSDAITARNLIAAQYGELSGLFNGMAGDIEEGFRFLEAEEERIVGRLDKLGIIPYEVSAVECVSGSCEVYLRLPPMAKQTLVEGVVSEVLNRSMSFERTEEGLSKYVSEPNYAVETAVLQLPREGCCVNGDSVTVFKTEGGRLCAILADGMGSGSEASYESAAALRLLTSFLKSGFSVKTALGILNSALCLNMNNEMYSTVDLLSIDLYRGTAELYKIGSAETVILNNGEVRVLSSNSVPVGILSDIRLENRGMALCEGDIILMMTDGITEAGCSAARSEWLRNIIIKPFESMEELAAAVMDTALEKNKSAAKDDMSVIALRIMGA